MFNLERQCQLQLIQSLKKCSETNSKFPIPIFKSFDVKGTSGKINNSWKCGVANNIRSALGVTLWIMMQCDATGRIVSFLVIDRKYHLDQISYPQIHPQISQIHSKKFYYCFLFFLRKFFFLTWVETFFKAANILFAHCINFWSQKYTFKIETKFIVDNHNHFLFGSFSNYKPFSRSNHSESKFSRIIDID